VPKTSQGGRIFCQFPLSYKLLRQPAEHAAGVFPKAFVRDFVASAQVNDYGSPAGDFVHQIARREPILSAQPVVVFDKDAVAGLESLYEQGNAASTPLVLAHLSTSHRVGDSLSRADPVIGYLVGEG